MNSLQSESFNLEGITFELDSDAVIGIDIKIQVNYGGLYYVERHVKPELTDKELNVFQGVYESVMAHLNDVVIDAKVDPIAISVDPVIKDRPAKVADSGAAEKIGG